MLHWLRAFTFFALGFVAQLFFIVTGLVVCFLPKSKDKSKCVPFTVPSNIGSWFPVHLPKWAWLWDNDADGARGDKRGWYWCEYMPKMPTAFKYWFWLAIRNPANNFKRFVLGFGIRKEEIKTIYGVDYVRDDFNSTGWQLVKAGWRYHLYIVRRYGESDRALVIEFGNKFQVRHNDATYEDEHKYFKGFTFEINPNKGIS